MTQRRHVDDLFTDALDDELSPIDDARFYAHIHSCKDCAAAYAEFTATVEALRELPKARMAQVVHLPSTPPVAEESGRRRISVGWLNPGGLLRRFPATALAGAAAVVLIVVALAHGAGTTGSGSTADQALGNGGTGGVAPAIAQGSTAAEAACASQVTAVTQSTPPSNFSAPEVVSAPSLPGASLVLSASTLSVTAGQDVSLYAQFSAPQVSAGAPGSTGVTTETHSLRPCVTVTVGGSGKGLGVKSVPGIFGGEGAYAPQPASPAAGDTVDGSSGEGAPIFVFTVPAGTAPGTVLHVVASVPAGYEGFGSPALTATLTITTR